MRNSKLLVFLACLVISLTANSQVKKSKPQTNAPVKKTLLEDKGPLSPEDYKFYFLARRGSTGVVNGTYTLKDKPSPSNNLTTPLVLIDVRNMKELAWWPETKISIKQGNIYGYTTDNKGSLLFKYTPTGKFSFSKFLNWKTPSGEQGQLLKSGDDKQVYTIYNNDVWIGDFDISTGISSNMHQVTQTGLISEYGDSYMRNDILILSNYIVNIKDGNYKKTASGASYILNDSCPFFRTHILYGKDGQTPVPGIHSFNDWNYGFSTETNLSSVLYWINRDQTKFITSRTEKGKQVQFIQDLNDPNFASKKPIYVTWNQTVATPDGALWGPLLELAISPRSKYLVTPGGVLPEKSSGVLYVYNLETLAEYYLPINIGQYPPDETAWADDTHLIFTMRADRMNPAMLNEQTRVTTENQGTYILDVETKQIKRLTPYLIADYDKSFVRLLDAKTILFEANNYIFKCNSDGSGLIQLTKIPEVYKLVGAFIK